MLRRLACTLLLAVLTAATALAADNRAVNRSKGSASSPTSASSAQATPTLVEGEIEGAKFVIAQPKKWNRCVLLLAHGYRSESSPLVADLFVQRGAYQTLLNEGWIVAKTSYRRNGIIIDDAIADLDALRAHIAEAYGQPERVLLEGESMGGLIVTLMAERERLTSATGQPLYSGAVAIGAALNVKEVRPRAALTYKAFLPILFLTNQSELDGPVSYVTSPPSTDGRSVTPALFRVSRDGHVNVNQNERLLAVRALNGWVEQGAKSLPKPAPGEPYFDATQPAQPQPSQVTMLPDGRSFSSQISEVSAVYGNLQLNAQPADFEAAGIKPLTWFQLVIGEKNYRVRYAKDFNDVKRGEWVAFPNADGFTWLVRNYANAAAGSGLKLGDSVTLRRFNDSSEK